MDPILEEMRRVKAVTDIRPARFRFWVSHLAERLAILEALEAERAAKAPAKSKAVSA